MLKEGSYLYYYDADTDSVETAVISELYIDNLNTKDMWQSRPMMSVSLFVGGNKEMITNYTFPVSELGINVISIGHSHPAFFDTYDKAAANSLPF